ncbi:MAG: VIT domain-containing protein [Planctomycetota bacterium]
MNRFVRIFLSLIAGIALIAGCEGGALGVKREAAGADGAPAPGMIMNAERAAFDEIVVIEGLSSVEGPIEREELGGGELRARVDGEEREVPLPLKHTDIKGRITLQVASVRVRQEYHNPYSEKIEAVYVFPLPQNAAVTDFIMAIGERKIRGIIRKREEARRIYEEAKRQGYVASLLSQERANVFTQSVANIEPGKQIDVEIAYFHTLRYEDGGYEFVFPMVVGPRFNPPGSKDGVGAVTFGQPGASGQSTEVAYLRPTEISPHLVSLSLHLDAGLEIGKLECPTHAIDVKWQGPEKAQIQLKEVDRIPNRDFVLRYRVAGSEVLGALSTFRDESGGYFLLMLQPPQSLEDLGSPGPREMIFVVDCSGSMKGEPLSTCKRAMRRCLKRLRPQDSFQVIRFSNDASQLGAKPITATPGNVRKGLRYLDRLQASGGTMMIRGIRAALDYPHDAERHRIVTFMTDGYIGNEREILGEIHQRLGGARIFSFGVGSSVNRFLMERMARFGRGVAAFVGTDESSERAVDGLFRRLERPALTDLEFDWGAMEVDEVHPAPLPDLFVGRPVVLHGRFRGSADTTITLKGRAGGRDLRFEIPTRSEANTQSEALAKVWARAKIASLYNEMILGSVSGQEDAITETALNYGLVSSFTSFVAVDSARRTEGGHGTTVQVPVPVPKGVRYDTTVPEK